MSTDSEEDTIDSKVARLIEEYGLGEGYGERLESLWTADDGDRESLRTLADRLNEALLEAAMTDAGMSPVNGEVANMYRLLADDEVSNAEAMRVQRRLEREGVDVDELRRDFVTYQAIRSYLKENRGAEYTRSEADPLEREKTNVQKLRGRMVSVIDGNVSHLRDSDELTLGEFQTLADVRIICEDCNSQFDISELLDRGGCHCETES